MQHTPEDLNEKMLRHAIQGSPRLAGFLTDLTSKAGTSQCEPQEITTPKRTSRSDTTKAGTVVREAVDKEIVEESEGAAPDSGKGGPASTGAEGTSPETQPTSVSGPSFNSPPLTTSGIYPSHLVSALDLEFTNPGYMPPHAPDDSAESVDALLPTKEVTPPSGSISPPVSMQNSAPLLEADFVPNTADEISQVQLKSVPKESGIPAPQTPDRTEPELSESTSRPIPAQESQSARLSTPASPPPIKTTFSSAPENAAPTATRNGFPRDKHIPEKSNLIWGIAALGALLVLFATILFTWPTISQHLGSSALPPPPAGHDQPRVGFNTTSPSPSAQAPDSPPTSTSQTAPAGMTQISSVQPTPDTDTLKADQPESSSPTNTAGSTPPNSRGGKEVAGSRLGAH